MHRKAMITSLSVAISLLVICAMAAMKDERPTLSIDDQVRDRLHQLQQKSDRTAAESKRAEAEAALKDERAEAERAAARAAIEAEHRRNKRPKRRIRRYSWLSPAAARGKLWNVPDDDANSKQATITAFLRICIAEADGHPQDCVGIWQVLKNIRRRSCGRNQVRRITECEEGYGETMLSVMRRAQPHILSMPGYELRNRRAGWIRNLNSCEDPPEGWIGNENQWDSQYGAKLCPYTLQLTKHLLAGKLPPPRPGHRLEWLPGHPIAWGGRCESKRGSCDDRIACSRGLIRIRNGPKTFNAFWRFPVDDEEIEPICEQMGYMSKAGRARYEASRTTKGSGDADSET